MDIRVLPLELYVEKFIEPRRQGRRYHGEEGYIYRVDGEESEDVAALPDGLQVAALAPVAVPAGEFIADAKTVQRLVSMHQKLVALSGQIEEVLRS